MTTLPNDRWPKLLDCVTDRPESADAIFRRYASVPAHKSLAHTLRRTRSQVGKTLQAMAERGMIERQHGTPDGIPIPAFSRKR